MNTVAGSPTSDEYKVRPEYINGRAILDTVCAGNLNAFSQIVKRYPQQVGGMLNDHPTRSIGARIARHIEECFELPTNWLSTPRSYEEAVAYVQAHVTSVSPPQRETQDLRSQSPNPPRRIVEYQKQIPIPQGMLTSADRERLVANARNMKAHYTSLLGQSGIDDPEDKLPSLNDVEVFIRNASRYNPEPVDVEREFKHAVITPGVPAVAGPRYVHKLLATTANSRYNFGSLIVFDRKGKPARVSIVTVETLSIKVDPNGVPDIQESQVPGILSSLRSATELADGGVLGCPLVHFMLVSVEDQRPDTEHPEYLSVSVASDFYDRVRIINSWQLAPPHYGVDPTALDLLTEPD